MNLFLDKLTPSLNETQRMHWTDRRKEIVTWRWLLRASNVSGGPFKKLVVTRVGSRLLDADNLAGGAKNLVDAIRKEGLIEDDRPGKVALSFDQRIGSPEGMEIELE